MISVLTVFFPGLAQFTAGHHGKALKMFLIGCVAGAVTGVLGWFLCGIWSLIEYERSRVPQPRIALANASEPPRMISRWESTSAFLKFVLVALALAVAAYSISRGGELESLKLPGLVELHFTSSWQR